MSRYENAQEQHENSVLRQMNDPASPWYGLGYDTIDQWTRNAPAGFDPGFVPGQEIDLRTLAKVLERLNMPGFYEGIDNGMTLDQYLAHPNSMIKVENGKYVYRPEQAQGDFVSKDRESFMESLGALPMVLGAFGAPFLSSLGIIGPGAGILGSAEFPTFLGDAVSAGASGAAGAAGSAASGFPGIEAADFSLHTPGAGFGGQGTSGLGLSTTTSGGAGALGAGAGTATGAGLGLQAVGASGAPIAAAGLGAGAAGGGFWESLLNSVSGAKGAVGAGSTLGSFLKAGGSILEWLQSKENADQLAVALSGAADRADPFGSQRPFYQNMLRDSYTDPNFWKNNAVFKGITDVASSDAQRVAAARGFNNSSNVLYDVADRIQKTGMNYATNFQGQLAQNAGAGFSPGTAANIAAQGASQVQQANQQANGAMGNVISNIPNLVNGIKGILA